MTSSFPFTQNCGRVRWFKIRLIWMTFTFQTALIFIVFFASLLSYQFLNFVTSIYFWFNNVLWGGRLFVASCFTALSWTARLLFWFSWSFSFWLFGWLIQIWIHASDSSLRSIGGNWVGSAIYCLFVFGLVFAKDCKLLQDCDWTRWLLRLVLRIRGCWCNCSC